MSVTGTACKINVKNMDYFKYKKIVIDGSRDDYAQCSREVRSLCDCVQTLAFRDEEFDEASDRTRFQEIISNYRQILSGKRIDPVDLRTKNGWWADNSSGVICSAGKFKTSALKETLVAKAKEWLSRRGAVCGRTPKDDQELNERIEGPGLYVFKHKEHQCFQLVTTADKIFQKCSDFLKSAFDGKSNEPIAALLVTSTATDWDFYFISVDQNEGDEVMRVLENDVILRHDSIWPHGLNVSLHIRTPTEISEFRKSCSRHRWPPEAETISEQEIDLERLRKHISLSNKALSTQNSPNNENNSAQISPTTEERDFICVTDVALQNSAPSIPVISPKSKSNTEMDKNGRLPPMVSNKKLAPRPASGTQVPRPASAPKPMSTKSPKLSRRAGTGPDLNKSEPTTSSIPCSILSSRIPISPDQKQRKGRSTEALARSKVNSSVDASEASTRTQKMERSRSVSSVSPGKESKKEDKHIKTSNSIGTSGNTRPSPHRDTKASPRPSTGANKSKPK